MMRRSNMKRSPVAAILIVAMIASATVLFGAPGATIRITAPAAGASVRGEIDIVAVVRTSAEISYVILGVDDERPCATNTGPYRFQLDTRALSDGPHRIFVEAYDNYGLIASSKAVTIHVKNGARPAMIAQKAPRSPMTAKTASGTAPAKPAQKPQSQVATKPLSRPASAPARSVPSQPSPLPGPKTVAIADATETDRSVSPPMLSRGPLPEPSLTTPARSTQPTRPGSHSRLPVKAAALPSSGARGHTIVLNGQIVGFDVAPVVKHGRLQAGFRALFTQAGARVSWASETKTARSVSDRLTVEIPIGSATARVNGKPVDIGMVAIIRDSRTIIPVRFFAAVTDSTLHWDNQTRVATLGTRTRAVATRPSD